MATSDMPNIPDSCLSANELVDAYNGVLPKNRLHHLENCSLCEAAVDGILLMEEPPVSGDDLLKMLNPSFEDEVFKKPHPVHKLKVFNSLRILIAASVVGFLFYAASLYQNKQRANASILEAFANVEEPYSRRTRSIERPRDVYFEAALAYEKQDYTSSLNLYHKTLANVKSISLITRGHYETGIVHWKAGNIDSAIHYLTTARFGEDMFYEDATWALAQVYRKDNKLTEAKVLFNDLIYIDDSPYKQKAEELLELLD